ncbi:hypothetical protein BCR42DRAFT_181393 [Absidia repens]|uniref:Uncharacterized protein n=1 Tax=Absidia repens TaxID=90262 RepID=A0A1X2HYC9_9FUNG|nr:hypothetical protein BCR42DRAFT_181393 [Absidia repens]
MPACHTVLYSVVRACVLFHCFCSIILCQCSCHTTFRILPWSSSLYWVVSVWKFKAAQSSSSLRTVVPSAFCHANQREAFIGHAKMRWKSSSMYFWQIEH